MTKRIQWLDSLRVLAFLFVIIYHLAGQVLPAGFFGVNLFFALSGFLITAKFLDEVLKEGDGDSYGLFLRKRGSRLLPGILLMIFITSCFLLVASADLRVDYFRQLAGVLGFMTNWYEIVSGGSYEAQFIPHIYVHTWTLAIEMHFYLIWGAVLYLMAGQIHQRRPERKVKPARRQVQLRLQIFILSLAFFFLPHLLMVVGSFLGWSTAFLYFSDLTRLSPFFVGALLASLTGMASVPYPAQKMAGDLPTPLLWALALVPLLLMAVMSLQLTYEDPSTYRWGFLLVDVLCFLSLSGARLLDIKSAVWREPGFIRRLSRWSYGFYLFHWPIFVALSTTPLAQPVTVFFTLLLAFLTSGFNDRVWEPFLLGKALPPAFRGLKDKMKKSTLLAAFLALLLIIIQVFTAPTLLSLENQLWASTLNQELDQVVEEGKKVKDLLTREKLAEKEKKEEAELMKKAKSEGFTMVGDSVTLGMRENILAAFPKARVNGKVSRFLHQGPDILRSLAKSGQLKEMVVIGLGNNVYPSFKKTCREIIDLLPSGSRLVFISPFQRDARASSDVEKYANYLPQLEKDYSFVTIADWNRVAKAHAALFEGTDGVHFYAHKDGIPLYIDTLKAALTEAYKKPAKK